MSYQLTDGSKIKPLADRVVVHMMKPPSTTKGGIKLVDSTQYVMWGIVATVGDDVKALKEGDKVFLPKKMGEEFVIGEGEIFWVLPERSIAVVIDEAECKEPNGFVVAEGAITHATAEFSPVMDAAVQEHLDAAGSAAQSAAVDPTAKPSWAQNL